MKKQPVVFILCGKRGEGKTSFLADLAVQLKNTGVKTDGILAPAMPGEGLPGRYSLHHIQSGRELTLCKRDYSAGWIKAGPFYFNPEALEAGNRILTHPGILDNDLVILDEIGKFELEGLIWAGSFSRLLGRATCPLIFSVRDTYIEEIISHWDLQEAVIFNLSQSTLAGAMEDIRNV